MHLLVYFDDLVPSHARLHELHARMGYRRVDISLPWASLLDNVDLRTFCTLLRPRLRHVLHVPPAAVLDKQNPWDISEILHNRLFLSSITVLEGNAIVLEQLGFDGVISVVERRNRPMKAFHATKSPSLLHLAIEVADRPDCGPELAAHFDPVYSFILRCNRVLIHCEAGQVFFLLGVSHPPSPSLAFLSRGLPPWCWPF